MFLGVLVLRSSPNKAVEDTTSYERLRSMLDNLPVGVYRGTSDGRILEANRTFAELLAYDSIDEVKRVNLNDIYVRKTDRIGHLEKLREANVFAEFELRKKDGGTIWARDYPKATLGASGYVDYMDGVLVQTQGIEAIVRDITERRRLEIMKDHFISSATHELRTPLVSIKGYADFILAENPESSITNIRPFVEVMKRNADRLLELTNDLLDAQSHGIRENPAEDATGRYQGPSKRVCTGTAASSQPEGPPSSHGNPLGDITNSRRPIATKSGLREHHEQCDKIHA